MRRRWFLTLSLVAAFAAITVGKLLWEAVELSSLTAVSEGVDRTKPILSALRFALISLLAVLWPWILRLRLSAGVDVEAARARWMALRWRIVGWLLVIELVIGQNLFGRFFSLATRTA